MSANTVILEHPEHRGRWTLDPKDNCVEGWFLKAGAKKPKLTRVPTARCAEGDPVAEVKAWAERLKSQGFVDTDQAPVTRGPTETILANWSATGFVEDADRIPDVLGAGKAINNGKVRITGFHKTTEFVFGEPVVRIAMQAGNLCSEREVATMLKIQQEVPELDITIIDPMQDNLEITPQVAKQTWPEIETHLIALGLIFDTKALAALGGRKKARTWSL